jgi:hypothetical protein
LEAGVSVVKIFVEIFVVVHLLCLFLVLVDVAVELLLLLRGCGPREADDASSLRL